MTLYRGNPPARVMPDLAPLSPSEPPPLQERGITVLISLILCEGKVTVC